jgi:hypothetical protein
MVVGSGRHWQPPYGIQRIREALDDVAECRDLITRKPEKRKRNRPGHNPGGSRAPIRIDGADR